MRIGYCLDFIRQINTAVTLNTVCKFHLEDFLREGNGFKNYVEDALTPTVFSL